MLGSLCCRDSKIPEPPAGHGWKEVRFDHAVTWLASWTENVHNSIKYVMLNPSSKLKVRPLPGSWPSALSRAHCPQGSTGGRAGGCAFEGLWQGCPEIGWEVTASSKIVLCPAPLFLKQDFNFTLTVKSPSLDSAPSPRPHPAGVQMAVVPRDPDSWGAGGGQLP